MSNAIDFGGLAASLRADRARLLRPGEEALWPALSGESARRVRRTVHQLERSEPEAFGLFGSVDEIYVAIVDVFDSDEPSVSSVAELIAALRGVAHEKWLVATPLVNVRPPERVESLGQGAAFAPTLAPDRTDHGQVRADLRDLFGGTVQVGWRTHHYVDETPVDCRHTASLVTEERGSRRTSEHRAMVKAQFVLAAWTLLSPPHDEMYTPLWPVATEWLPQPYFQVTQQTAPLPQEGSSQRSKGMTVVYGPDDAALYEPPGDAARLAPLRAVSMAGSHRPAAALLAASWNLYLAARQPNDLQWIDRLVLMVRAREALCEPLAGSADSFLDRWQRLSRHLNLTAAMRKRGFDAQDIASVTKRAWSLRTLGTHSADAALMSLGYPHDRDRVVRRGVVVPGAELAPLHIREGAEPPFAAAHIAAVELWRRMLDSDFDETTWEALFADDQQAHH